MNEMIKRIKTDIAHIIQNKEECICGASMDMNEWKKSKREPVLPCQRTCIKRPDKRCWDPGKIQVHLSRDVHAFVSNYFDL